MELATRRDGGNMAGCLDRAFRYVVAPFPTSASLPVTPDRHLAASSRQGAIARAVTGDGAGADITAGLIASAVTIAYCLSFAALLFQGPLRPGLAIGLWAFLAGTAITGAIVALTTTLPPVDAGPDNPSVAVMSVLGATVSAPLLAKGASASVAVTHVLLAISLAVLMTGALLYAVGHFRLGQIVRFVPYPVIAGFLAGSGALLLIGAVTVVTGRTIASLAILETFSSPDGMKILIAVGFAVSVLVLRRLLASAAVLPIAFLACAIVLNLVLWRSGLREGWYITGAGNLTPWIPAAVMLAGEIHWLVILRSAVEIAAVAGVVLMALLLDVSSLEVARGRVADIDLEFRSNGIANLACAPLGGFGGNLSMGASRLIEEMGSRSRLSGLVSALAVVAVLVTGIDLPAWVPTPVLGGLLMYMGIVVLADTFRQSPAQRSLLELGLALAIMVAIVQLGYLWGVILGLVGACMMFAFSYSRVGVIRRHVTRAAFTSDVERSTAESAALVRHGDRIHVVWLSGFVFFGSSNGVLERIRTAVEARGGTSASYLVLDCSAVSGFDTSAILSLIKLRNLADEKGMTIVYAGLTPDLLLAFEEARLFGRDTRHRVAPTRGEAVEWCEERLLEGLEPNSEDRPTIETWLAREIGEGSEKLLTHYLERRDVEGGTRLYAQGDPSDAIDLVASGAVTVNLDQEGGQRVRIRRMTRSTVLGEMGFFRGRPRGASVYAEGPTVIYTLTRANYEQLAKEDPALAARFLEAIVRTLSDRIEFANREIAALA